MFLPQNHIEGHFIKLCGHLEAEGALPGESKGSHGKRSCFARKPSDSGVGGKPAASRCVIPELKALLPPVPSVKFLSSPLLILHGEDDRTVPLECGKKVHAEPSTTPTQAVLALLSATQLHWGLTFQASPGP